MTSPHRNRFRSTILAPAILAVSLLALAGCTAGGTAAPTGPDVPAEVAPSLPPAPAAAFDGDCDSVFAAADLSDVLGQPMGNPVEYAASPSALTVAVEVVGGVGCSWQASGNETGEGAYLDTIVFPKAAVPDAELQDPYCYSTENGDTVLNACSFTAEASGYLVSGVAYVRPGQSESEAQAAVGALVALFATSAESVGEPVLPVTADGAWSTPPECEVLSAAADLPGVLNSPELVAYAADGPSEAPPALFSVASAAGYFSCSLTYDDGETPAGSVPSFALTGLAGASFVQPRLVEAGGLSYEVEGYDFSVLTADDQLNVFDGSNWLTIVSSAYSSEATELPSLVPAVAPVFAALTGQ